MDRRGAKILKGARIGANSIITTNAVVLKGEYPAQSLIAGNPAKVIKENAPNWSRDTKTYQNTAIE